MQNELVGAMNWSSLGALDELWEGEMRAAHVDGHELVVLRLHGGDVHVYQGICPHQEQRLADGEFDGTVLTCFGHLWQFDAVTGDGVNPTGCTLARYPVEIVEGDIRVATTDVSPNYSF